jgi:hypothetical protein
MSRRQTMTESDWLSCDDPQAMLDWLQARGQLSERQARLFAVAVVRRVWRLLTDPASRRAVETAERFAEGLATGQELSDAATEAQRGASDPAGAAFAAWATAGGFTTGAGAAAWAARQAAEAAAGIPHTPTDADPWAQTHPDEFARRKGVWEAERCHQAALLKSIAGNPFRPVRLDLSWQTPAVLGLATTIYEERRFEDLPILADALEETGADNQEILRHLRQQEPGHVRGCWCLDLVLGKE